MTTQFVKFRRFITFQYTARAFIFCILSREKRIEHYRTLFLFMPPAKSKSNISPNQVLPKVAEP